MDSGINGWKRSAIGHVKAHGRITNREYCEPNKVGHATAYRYLRDMVSRRIMLKKGSAPKIHALHRSISKLIRKY